MNKLAIVCAILFFRSVTAMVVKTVIRNNSNQEICILNSEKSVIKNVNPGNSINLEQVNYKDSFHLGSLYIKFLKSDLDLKFENKFTLKNKSFMVEACLFIGRNGLLTRFNDAEVDNVEKNQFSFDIDIAPVPSQSMVSIHVLDTSGD